MADDNPIDPGQDGQNPRRSVPAADQPFDFDPDLDSEPGDDLEHWLEAEEALRQRRSNLVDFGLPPRLADRDAR